MSIDDATIRSVADRLRQANSSRTPCEPVVDLLTGGGVADAYAVQELNTAITWLAYPGRKNTTGKAASVDFHLSAGKSD